MAQNAERGTEQKDTKERVLGRRISFDEDLRTVADKETRDPGNPEKDFISSPVGHAIDCRPGALQVLGHFSASDPDDIPFWPELLPGNTLQGEIRDDRQVGKTILVRAKTITTQEVGHSRCSFIVLADGKVSGRSAATTLLAQSALTT